MMKFKDKLPNDLLDETLVSLPVKSLLRFKGVSEKWRALIESPRFISAHLKHQRDIMMVRRCSNAKSQNDDEIGVLSFHDPDSLELEKIRPDFPIPSFNRIMIKQFNDEPVHLLGHSNGIICLKVNGTIILCNPALHKFKPLPLCDPPLDEYSCHMGYGFGHSTANNFKVVQLFYALNRKFKRIGGDEEPWIVIARLYDSSTNTWRGIERHTTTCCIYQDDRQGVFFNGSCHWALTNNIPDANQNVILSFNLKTEAFRMLKYHDHNERQELQDHNEDELQTQGRLRSLLVINDCLAMVHYNPQERGSTVDIWVMKDYGVKESWTKKFVIEPVGVIRPFVAWKNDQLLLEEDGQLASYSFDGTEVKKYDVNAVDTSQIKKYDINDKKNNLQAIFYKESLIDLETIPTMEELNNNESSSGLNLEKEKEKEKEE